MASNLPRIYLASRSSRRRELLKQIAVPFEVLLFRERGLRGRDMEEAPREDEAPEAYRVYDQREALKIVLIP